MYLTIKETAEYLEVAEAQVRQLIYQKQIRALHDGEKYLINDDQFNTHFEQVDNYKKLVQEILEEPIPESVDVKDED
ncbi:hypothetical protein GCM10011351_07900 [Paraliobacillus quinghaiensis]|uniref:Helix-turn-helix domain-containing protein n=1 Tax=Paraliobacillus quinghaiensis TaxID=470815 RepID=A0A917TJ31_9BACI|nr:excisionase family DNA-binding protein [Paraliobacillus quinghaiensis]GGM24533.1 hypothetical protein GCM10011351_07900 [Paraliobacillus quinghaiensis]